MSATVVQWLKRSLKTHEVVSSSLNSDLFLFVCLFVFFNFFLHVLMFNYFNIGKLVLYVIK